MPAVVRRYVGLPCATLFLVAGCELAADADSPSSDVAQPSEPTHWETSGYEITPLEVRPYDGNSLLDLDSPDRTADDDGVHVYERDGERHFHPVAMAQYGIDALRGWSTTGNEEYLRRALANGEKLLDVSIESADALWFPYTFDHPLAAGTDEDITAPWWSGMAQGQAMSLFVRLYEETGDEKWLDAADGVFLSLRVERDGDSPWLLYVDDGFVWFEEYAGQTEPLRVLNGHIFAIYGLYDYFMLTGNEESKRLLDAGITTVKQHMSQFRVEGEYSYYCLRQGLCDVVPGFQNERYHRIHTKQLAVLGQLTGDPAFQEMSELFGLDKEAAEAASGPAG